MTTAAAYLTVLTVILALVAGFKSPVQRFAVPGATLSFLGVAVCLAIDGVT